MVKKHELRVYNVEVREKAFYCNKSGIQPNTCQYEGKIIIIHSKVFVAF